MKLRFLASCQFDARSDALPDAVVRVANWEDSIMRLALLSSCSSGAVLRVFISLWMASWRAVIWWVSASALTEKRPGF